MTYHSSLQTSPQFINALKRARELSENVSAESGGALDIFPYSVFYVYYEQYLTIVSDMCLNLGLALGRLVCVCVCVCVCAHFCVILGVNVRFL